MNEIKDLEQGMEEVLIEDHQDCRLVNSMHQIIDGLHGKPDEAQKFTIFRVPENIRKSKAHLFEPAVISIGPYHRQSHPYHHQNRPYHHQSRPHLHAMEEMKWRVLRDIRSQGLDLGACTRAIKKLEVQARMCYSEIIDMDSNSFIEMMVLDGCFILEYIFDLSGHNSDPVQYAGWSSKMISDDLILMENQIPFFILQTLYHSFTRKNLGPEEQRQIANFLRTKMNMMPTEVQPPPKEIDHLLHLFYCYFVPDMPPHESPIKPEENKHRLWEKAQHHIRNIIKPLQKLSRGLRNIIKPLQKPSRENGPHNSGLMASALGIPCATELRGVGVRFRKKDPKCHFMDVTFQSGVLEIPNLRIHDQLAPRYMNLIALEQCKSLEEPRPISSFVALMNAIVNTTKDVIKLQRKGIIDNMLSSEEEVAILFNQTSLYVTLDVNHFFAPLVNNINEYRKSKKHRYKYMLMHNYFSNPWSTLSLLGAIILLLLTFMQTFYAVFGYHHPPH